MSLKKVLSSVVAGVAALGLAGSTVSAAHAAPVVPPTGWKMLVHQTTSSYLFPDAYVDTEGEEVQTYNQPLKPGQGYKWLIQSTLNGDGTYTIKSNPHRLCLTAGATVGAIIKMEKCTGDVSQMWYLQLVPGTTDDWALVPYTYDDHALTAAGPDNYVYAKQMWGGDPDLTHAWRAVDPPRGR